VASKIFGIFFAYWFITGLAGVVTSIVHIGSFGGFIVFRIVFSLIVLFIFAWILLLRTNSLANYLELYDNTPFSTNLSSDYIMKIGTILIGLYVFAFKVGTFIKDLFNYIQKIKAPRSVFAPNWFATTNGIVSTMEITMQGLVILFSLFLVFNSSKVLEIINKYEKRKNPR
jgi:hypothetical protein